MKITVCDDSIKDLLDIEKLLIKYKNRYPDKTFELEKYSDPSRLYQRISEGKLTDIYILDMLMPRRTGLDLGRQIRTTGNDNVIIYITSSEDYALSYTKAKTEPTYMIKTKNGLLPIAYSKIEYIESVGRKLEVHLSDGKLLKTLYIRTSFEEEVQALIGHGNFLQTHKSFLVNLDYVKQLTTDNVIMNSGKHLPVSRAKAPTVKREYLLFGIHLSVYTTALFQRKNF